MSRKIQLNEMPFKVLSGLLQYLPESFTSKVVGRDAVFKSTSTKTFEHEESLPSLPVPQLRSTLDTYLETVKPVVTDEEYKTTEALVKKFENGVGTQLQKILVKKAESEKNWVCSRLLIFLPTPGP